MVDGVGETVPEPGVVGVTLGLVDAEPETERVAVGVTEPVADGVGLVVIGGEAAVEA